MKFKDQISLIFNLVTLTNLSQEVEFNSVFTFILSVPMLAPKVCVPQGSILAPTLFLIYINDLLHLPKFSESLAYADDTVFINHSPVLTDLQLCCESDLETIRKWCEDNRMVINMKKSHYLLVDRSSSIPESEEFELRYDNQALLRKSETKLLGFW